MCQPWINYDNNENEYLIIGAFVCSQYSHIRYHHLIIGNVQNFVWSHKDDFLSRAEITFPLQLGICYILPYRQIMKRNNQLIN